MQIRNRRKRMNSTVFRIFCILLCFFVVSSFQISRSRCILQKKIQHCSNKSNKRNRIRLHDSITSTLGIDPETVQALSELQGTVSSGTSSGNVIVGK